MSWKNCLPTLQDLLCETIHVDEAVAAQLRLEETIQIKGFVPPGAGCLNSIPVPAVDNIYLFVEAFNSVLSLNMGGEGGLGAPTSWRDRTRTLEDELRSIVENIRVYLLAHQAVLTQRPFADHLDEVLRDAFQSDFRDWTCDAWKIAGRIRSAFPTIPPPPGEPVPTLSVCFYQGSAAGTGGWSVEPAVSGAYVDCPRQELVTRSTGGGQQGRETASEGELTGGSQPDLFGKTTRVERVPGSPDSFRNSEVGLR